MARVTRLCQGAGVIALSAVAAAAAPALAASQAHQKHHKGPSAETLAARRALLRQADVGSHWRSQAPPKQVPTLTCPAFAPHLTKLPKPGDAVGPTFSQTANGPFLSQSAYVFPKPAQALTYWHRVVTPRLSVCVAGSLTASSTSTVSFTVKHRGVMKVPVIGERSAGYRVTGVAAVSAQKIDVFLDMIVVGRGSGVTQLSFTTFSQPPPRSLELRLARLAAARLPADSGASGP